MVNEQINNTSSQCSFQHSRKMQLFSFTTILLLALVAAVALAQPPPNCASNVAILCSAGGGPAVYARDPQTGACTKYDNRCLFNVFNCIKYRENQSTLQEVGSC
ncbi:uncharacterized protein LOC105262393 [Musca domestica]|uniref:Uncharacterized protein LOC105262393 n=1 Tax=Musca domestica TaxID=7370 RepID=A0A1I8NIR6_MUSDO|nr:uncharacterized protein LOC105262393 [Musca domestica]